MEFPTSPNSTGEISYLDKDDINGPGSEKYMKRTGDKSVDYALYKIGQYSNSSELSEKIKFTKELDELLLQLGYRNVSAFYNVLKKLVSEDAVEIKIEVANQIPVLSRVLISEFSAYNDIVDQIVPILEQLLDDKRQDVLKSACSAGTSLAELMNKEDRGSFILTMFLRILHDEEEETKIRALAAIKDLILLLSPDICEWYILKEAMLLSSENIVKVRKAVAECIPRLSQRVQDSEGFEKLMKVFKELSKDSIWGVRKACVENISEMFEGLNETIQENFILPIFQELLSDKSNSVRQCAMLQLGPCIYNCKVQVPDEFIEQYAELAKNAGNKGEFQYHFAFNFPAVMSKVGKYGWCKLSSAYAYAINEADTRSRKCLIASIHEVGKILEVDLATFELSPIYESVFTENAVSKQIAVASLAKFLNVITPQARLGYLKYIKTMHKVAGNWRIKQVIGEQIGDIAELFEFEVLVNDIIPVALALADDKIAKVREKSALSLGKIVKIVSAKSETHEFLTTFTEYANGPTSKKIVFAIASQALVSFPKFTEKFGKHFQRLCEEKTPNIRICCAKVIRIAKDTQSPNSFWALLEEKLSHDFDADVRFEISGKYDVERGVKKLRPNTKKNSELMPPMFRALFPDDDLQEIIVFKSNGPFNFGTLKGLVTPSMNGFVEEIFLQSANKQRMLVDV